MLITYFYVFDYYFYVCTMKKLKTPTFCKCENCGIMFSDKPKRKYCTVSCKMKAYYKRKNKKQ